MTNSAEALRSALAHHKAGHLDEAEALYRQILQAEPGHADAMQLLGLIAHQRGDYARALELIARAIDVNPRQPVFHCNQGEVYRAMGRPADAAQAFRRAIELHPQFPEAYNNLGNALRSLGHSDQALVAYQEAIRLRANFVQAINNLGCLLQSRGDLPGAVAQHRRAIELAPDFAEAHDSLGTALNSLRQFEASAAAHRRAMQLAPHNAEYRVNLGVLYQAMKDTDKAIACYREALQANPRLALAHNNLGSILHELGRTHEAIASYRQSLQLQPGFAEAQFNLGVALQAVGDAPGALRAYLEAIRLKPRYEAALINCSQLLEVGQRFDEALKLYDQLIAADPDYALAHFTRSHILKLTNRASEAIAELMVVQRLRPDYPAVYTNLASLYHSTSRPDEAIEWCHAGLKLDPNDTSLLGNLAISLHQQGRGPEAIEAYRKVVALAPHDAAQHSNLLYALNFEPGYDAATLFAEHLAWGRRHAEPLTARALPHDNERSPDRRLRVGYVSAYFRHHAVNFFTEPILLSHDHRQFEIFCYSDVPSGDEVTQRIRDAADHWRHVVPLTDQQIAEQVRADKIDILVDLTGHIGGNRLLAFARKPAPVQVTYIGYQNTTGMSAMDYRLTDARADPPGLSDAYYTEKLVRLPRAFFCYKPADDAPPLTPLPAATLGQVTFGSFNNSPKVTRAVIDAWLTILGRVSDSRLLVLAYRGGYVERHFHQLAAERGIDPARIELCDKRIRSQYLALQQRADIALDPFPFNGHTTTCDSLWMGVPVVMLEGATYASRFGGSVLANVGLERLITRSVDEYIDTAVALAHDLETLTQWRDELRGRMVASALLDFAGFTRHLETAYRHMWHHWCHRENSR